MGRIQDKAIDGSVTGAEKVLASDVDNTTVNILLTDLKNYILSNLSSVKNVASSTYDGLLIIAGEGNTSMTSVEIGDILIGINTAFTGGIFRVMVATSNSPTSSAQTTIIDLGTGGGGLTSTYQLFSATNGQVSFILNTSPTNVDVIIDRVPQIPGTDYNFAGNTVTMTYGQDLGSVVQIRKY